MPAQPEVNGAGMIAEILLKGPGVGLIAYEVEIGGPNGRAVLEATKLAPAKLRSEQQSQHLLRGDYTGWD